MKKLFALILSLVMMTALTVPAFAVEYNETPVEGLGKDGIANIAVTGKYQLGDAETLYQVDIKWEGMTFTYTADTRWNAATQSKEDTEAQGSWEGLGKVTVSNRSNAAITATLSFACVDGVDVVGKFVDAESQEVEGVVLELEDATGEPVEKFAAFKIVDGRITALQNNTTIGTITVTLSAVAQ